jgi:hypothetical protein
MISLFFLQIRQETICTKNDLVTRSCFVLCLLKTIILKAFKQIILYYTGTKNIFVKTNIRLDIRYPAFGLAGYPAGRISDKNSIRCILIHNCTVPVHNIPLMVQVPNDGVADHVVPVYGPHSHYCS